MADVVRTEKQLKPVCVLKTLFWRACGSGTAVPDGRCSLQSPVKTGQSAHKLGKRAGSLQRLTIEIWTSLQYEFGVLLQNAGL